MGLLKITKQTDLRENLYETLEEIATGGSPHLIPTKNGGVVILSRKEYEEILFEKELLQQFQEPIKLSELTEEYQPTILFAAIQAPVQAF